MKNILLTFLSSLLLGMALQAQTAGKRLDIQFNKNVLQPGDSLVVNVDLKNEETGALDLSLATLDVIIESEQGLRTRLRWPVINGQSGGIFHLPDSLPPGRYRLLAALQQRFFEAVGKVQNADKIRSIQAMLLTKTGDWDEQEVAVAPDGSFTIRNWLFEDNAVLAFYDPRNRNRTLDIRLSTQLDSSYTPLATAGRAFYLGNPPASLRQGLGQPLNLSSGADFADRGSLLPAVIVRTTNKTVAQQFNEEYSTGLFRSGNERLISIFDNPTALAFPNIFSYLQGRVAGLQISTIGLGGGSAMWRGNPVSFFLDEIRVSPQQIASIPMSDIAIVKAYPPPFFGGPGGGAGGGIAIYTRRGGESSYLPDNRSVFRVRGYTPFSVVLKMDQLNLQADKCF